MRTTLYWMTSLAAIAAIGYFVGEGAGADPEDEGATRTMTSGPNKRGQKTPITLRGEQLDRILSQIFRRQVARDSRFLRSICKLEEPDRSALLRIVYAMLEEALSSHRGRTFPDEERAIASFVPLTRHVKRVVGEDPVGTLERRGAFTFSELDRDELVEVFLDAFTDERETARAVSFLSQPQVQALYTALRRETHAELTRWIGQKYSSVGAKDGAARQWLETLRIQVTEDPVGWTEGLGSSRTGKSVDD